MRAAMMLATASDMGMLNQMPFDPRNKGSMSRQGINTRTCLLSDRIMAFFAMSMLWKKLEVTI